MSTLPGLNMEDYLAWMYGLNVQDAPEANASLGIAEALGTVKHIRPAVTQEKFKELVTLYEKHREKIEELLSDFDEDDQSWRSYAERFDNYVDYSVTRKARAWMIEQGYWRYTAPAIIGVPDEYPLLIAGAGNTYKTTIALLIAYQEALMSESPGIKSIVVVSRELQPESIPAIITKFVPNVTPLDFFEYVKKKKITFVVTDNVEVNLPGPASECVFIIDEPMLFDWNPPRTREIFKSKVNELTAEGAKVITCCHMSQGPVSDPHSVGRSMSKTAINDSGLRECTKTFAFTSSRDKSVALSAPNETIFMDKFPELDGPIGETSNPI